MVPNPLLAVLYAVVGRAVSRARWLKRTDVVILGGVLALAAALSLFLIPQSPTSQQPLTADIFVAGALFESVPLADAPRDIAVPVAEGVNLVCVEGDGVYMKQAGCPQQICVSMGKISAAGQTIACIPCRVLVVLRVNGDGSGGEEADTDAISG